MCKRTMLQLSLLQKFALKQWEKVTVVICLISCIHIFIEYCHSKGENVPYHALQLAMVSFCSMDFSYYISAGIWITG